VRKQRIAIRLCIGGNLSANLASGPCLGLDDHRLLDHRLKRRGKRPCRDVVGTARWKRIDDRDCTRGESLLCARGPGRRKSGSADNEATAIHDCPPELAPAQRRPCYPCTRPMACTAASTRLASSSQNFANSG